MCVRERVAIGEGAKIKPGSAPRCFFSVKPHHGIKTLHFLPSSSLEKRACLRRALRAARGGERAGRRAGEDTAVGWPSRAKSAGSRLGRSGRKRSAAPSAFSGRVRRARSMSAQKASHEAAAGAWAGLVGTVLGYPLDVVKSRMQTAHAGARVANATNPATSASVRPRGVPGGAGFVASFTKLAREEGLRGAYRGLGPPVCMMMLMNAVNFTAFNRAKEALGVEGPVGLARARARGRSPRVRVRRRLARGRGGDGGWAAVRAHRHAFRAREAPDADGGEARGRAEPKNTLGQSSASTKARVIRVSVRDDASLDVRLARFLPGRRHERRARVSVQRRVFSTFEHTRFGFADACEARGIRREAAIATAGGSRAPPPGSCPSRWTA